MKFNEPLTIDWLCTFLNAKAIGNTAQLATGINELHKVEAGDIAFVDHPKYYDQCINSAATIIIINAETNFPAHKTLLVLDEPFEAYQKITNHFRPLIPQTKLISEHAILGEATVIMPNSFVGNHVTIGSNCIIHPNVTIYDYVTIGNNVTIHSGSVIGKEAFYYNTKKNRPVWYKKMNSCGSVILEDFVEIGANCCIDKGVSNHTIIGAGTKMDNHVQVGHDVVIGKNCIIGSQVGIAGLTTIGNGVTIWGQAAVNKTLNIGDNVTVLGRSGVMKNIEPGKVVFGLPAQDAMDQKKEMIWIKRIPEIWSRLVKLEGNKFD